jgi:hypothetical protein
MASCATDHRRADVHVDWFRVLADLQYAGCSNSEAALFLNIPLSTLRGWKDGSEPRHCDGVRLVSLWAEIIGKPREDAPVVDKYDWRA